MHYETTRQAWAAIKAAHLSSAAFILEHDYAHGSGWIVKQQGHEPLTLAQRTKLEALAGPDAPRPVAVKPVAKPVRAREPKPAQHDAAPRGTRVQGATFVCKEIAATMSMTDREAFVAACIARGVGASTANTQFYRLRTK